jgi:hypothetical protein
LCSEIYAFFLASYWRAERKNLKIKLSLLYSKVIYFMMRSRKSLPGAGSLMPVLGTAFLGMGRGILEEGASTVWDRMGGGPRSAASTPPTGDTTDQTEKKCQIMFPEGGAGTVCHGDPVKNVCLRGTRIIKEGNFSLSPPTIQLLTGCKASSPRTGKRRTLLKRNEGWRLSLCYLKGEG